MHFSFVRNWNSFNLTAPFCIPVISVWKFLLLCTLTCIMLFCSVHFYFWNNVHRLILWLGNLAWNLKEYTLKIFIPLNLIIILHQGGLVVKGICLKCRRSKFYFCTRKITRNRKLAHLLFLPGKFIDWGPGLGYGHKRLAKSRTWHCNTHTIYV